MRAVWLAAFLFFATIGTGTQLSFLGDGVTREFPLGDKLIVVGSDSVLIAGRLLGSDEYTLDYRHRALLLWQAPKPWDLVLIKYRQLAIDVAPYVGAGALVSRVAATNPGSEDSLVLLTRLDTGTAPGAELGVSGSKMIGATLGAADGGGIDQTTQLTITGRVEGIDVSGELSDQSSGIPAEGSTRDIEELDRVAVNLRAPWWRAGFGDVDLRFPAGEFGTISRSVMGARGALSVAEVEADAGYATPKGRFGRVVLTGIEGSQGPYVLAPDGRSAQIVAGSEAVWLDGVKLVRGWDEDYTIDYSTGEVILSNRHIVTRYSRVEAEFQFVVAAYSRADITGGVSYHPGPFEASLGVLREGDDPNRPSEGELTAAERQYLSSIGGDSSRAWLDGALYVGEGNGDYTADAGHYRYAGRDSGEYRVEFSLVGDSFGDYVYDDTLLAYRYVGLRAGNYLARRRVALPERQDIVFAHTGFRSSRSAVSVEGAFRRLSRNLFAPGGAGTSVAGLNVDADFGDSTTGVAYTRRMRGSGFEIPGSAPSVDFAYSWGGATEAARKVSDEVTARFNRGRLVAVSLDAGRMERYDSAPIARYSGDIRIGWVNLAAGRFGPVTRLSAGAGPALGMFRPTAGIRADASAGSRATRILAGLGVRPDARISAVADYEYSQEDDTASGSWSRVNRGNLVQSRLTWSSGEAYRVEALAGYQDRRFDFSSGVDLRQWNGGIDALLSPRSDVRLQLDAAQTNRRVQLRDEVFRYVGSGNGAYRRDSVSGQYFPDTDGDYARDLVATGRTAAARDWSANASFELSMLSPVSIFGTLGQALVQTDSGVLTQSDRVDIRAAISGFEPMFSPVLGVTSDRSSDRTLAATGSTVTRELTYAEVYTDRWSDLTGKFRFELERSRRDASAVRVQRHDTGWRVELMPVVNSRLRIEVTTAVERRVVDEPTEQASPFAVEALMTGLARTVSISGRLRLRGSVDVTRRWASVASLPADLAETEPIGWTPTAGLEFGYSVSSELSATARYSYVRRPGRATEHGFSAELRATF